MLENLDALVVDMQDAGARYYTFIWTMALVMEACQEQSKAVVVLDRPNPIGGEIIEGPVLQPEFASFVGLRSLPVRHGMTIAEVALYLKEAYNTGLAMYIVTTEGWKRRMWFEETGLPWVFPSPNMPTVETAAVYPGMCLLEATNLSEGRGTTRPFEIFGAPFIEPATLVAKLKESGLSGVLFRPLYFLPTFQKHAGRLCGGAQLHVTDRKKFKPFKTVAAILKAVKELYPKDFSWNQPPYEYEEVHLPVDILAGTDRFRKEIEEGTALDFMEAWWNRELIHFDREIRKKYLLLNESGEIIFSSNVGKNAVVITNTAVGPLYLAPLLKSLEEALFHVDVITIPDGEQHKTLFWMEQIYDQLLSFDLDTNSPVIALGGGVLGDMAGFAAATYLRGHPLVQIPTTLLAQVDSSVGGKTGVNLPKGKNMVGAFYQPRTVLIDPLVLRTLDTRELRSGLAEVIKYSIIDDQKFFSYRQTNIDKALQLDKSVLPAIIKTCCT